jgi:thiol-disulfide isomerase/thioredoxin
MKKILLTLSAFAIAATTAVNAQNLTLYEEFTGENCPPCAATNPGLWTLVTAAGNEAKILMIKYENNIPAASNPKGIYKTTLANTDLVAKRGTYYGNSFSPQGFHNSFKYGGAYPGHAGYLTQDRIDSMYNEMKANLKVQVMSFKFSQNNDSIFAVVKVTAPAAYTPTGANLKLRTAFVQTLDYSAPADQIYQGTNGEEKFENVVRQMLPDPTGTALPATWTAGQSQTYTLAAKLMSHITLLPRDKNPFLVAWVQNDANKGVLAVGRSSGADFPTNVTEAVEGIDYVSVYPNPATDLATVKMTIGKAADVTVYVTDMMGRNVYTSATQKLVAGTHKMSIVTDQYANGMYNVTIKANDDVVTKQVSIAK